MGVFGGGKGGGKHTMASKPNLLSALRVQTSAYGQVLPILYGQNRISGRLIWSGDFTAIPHTTTTRTGGKGGGGGQTVTETTYTYQTAVAIALCAGPVQNIYNVWTTKGKLALVNASVPYTVPSGGGGYTVPLPPGAQYHTIPANYSDLGVSRTDAYSNSVNDLGSDGLITLSGNMQTRMVRATGALAAGQYSLSGSTYSFSAADAGKVVLINYVYSVPDSAGNVGQPSSTLNLTLIPGQRPQPPWSYLTSMHPGQDLGYTGVAYVVAQSLDLGESGTLPNLSYEVMGLLPFGAGITDAEPSSIIGDLINNPFYGMNGAVPLDTANTLPQYQSYCMANGLFLSPVLDVQRTGAEWIQEILDATNSAAVWSEGLLKTVTYGDTTISGNGATFVPSTRKRYDLTTSDLLDEVKIKRPSVADVMNSVSVEFVNRYNDYNVEIAEDKDDAMIAQFGLRKASPRQFHSITTPGVAKLVANFLRKRQVEIRATYTFKLGWQFALLEPMDLVTLTIPELGYNQKPVRITAIRESDTGELEMDAEDFPWGTASPTQYPQQVPTAFSPRLNADPGMVNTPIVFEAPYQLSQSGQHELWIAVSGSMITNLLKYSEQLDNAVWLRNSNGVAASTVTPNNQTDPLGGQTADTVSFPATGAGQWAFLQQSFSDIVTVAGKTYTFSVWLKAAAPCVTTLAITDLAGNYAKSVTVNVTTTWTRFSATGTFISSGLVGSPIVLLGNGSSASAATLFAWGAQVEQAINPSNYVATTSAVGVQGNPNWGGCSVWVSQDSIEYKQIGKIYAPARMGVLTGAVAAGTGDPDTVNYFPVDMTMSRGTLLSGTQADADTYRTLCWCDGEFLAHQGANMTMANHYNVGQIPNGTAVYLRRGLFGTSSAAHAVGAQFVRLDDAVFTYEYDPAFIGKPIYLKFTSFNTAGMVEQSSGSVVGYQFIVLGVFSQMERVGKNLLSNPGFEINSVLTPVSTYPTEFPVPMGQRISDGWSCWNGIGIAPANVTGDTYMTSTLESSTPHSGSRSMIVLNKPGAVLPNDSAYYCMGAISDKIAVNPGESYSFGGYIRLSNDGGLPSGVSLYGVVRLVLYDGQANVLGQITYAGNGGVGNPDPSFVGPASGGVAFGGGYFLQSTYCTIPPTLGTSNARPAYAAVWCTVIVRNASSAGWTMTGLQFDCRFDDIFLYPQWSLAGDEIGKVGSISVAFPNAMSYTSTTSSVTWTWNINLSRTNLAMSVSSFSGSQTINGLSPGTYNFYPYIDEVNGILTMVSTGGVGSPSWAHSGSNVAWSQEQNRSDHFPLSAGPMPATVPTSGTGIGSGGGDGSCLRHDVLVREKTKGVVPVAALAAGDWVQCPVADDTPEGWAEVCEVKKGHTQQEWVHTHFNVGDWLATTPGHPFTLQDGSMRRAALLNLEDEVPCTTGITYPVQHSLESYTAQKVSVTLRSVHHVFYAGMNAPVILQHNLIPPPVS